MARITEELVRKCAEHNECEIFSLEELSLHQRNILKIEHLDKWCRDLKILYLHNNLISKIENLSKLKKLEYVNFTLNNITRIENLEGCESLQKLDFTVNFIGELTSIENLKGNYKLEELYLTGNPCVEYEGYREFVLATLPQLKRLDGKYIKVSERIAALQKYYQIRKEILEQQTRYMINVEKTSEEISISEVDNRNEKDECPESKSQKSFWKQSTKHTPQTRIEIYKHLEETNDEDKKEKKEPKPPRPLFAADGRPLNINQPKLKFEFVDDEENNTFKLDLGVYRYLCTSFLEVDIQPNYIRVRVRGKVFQLHLPKEVQPDSSTSVRSQTTGHLLITMPKVEDMLKSKISSSKAKGIPKVGKEDKEQKKCKVLDVTPSIMESIGNIATEHQNNIKEKEFLKKREIITESSNDISEFFDNPEVPPLI